MMKFYADRNRPDRVLEMGDYVYLKLQPLQKVLLSNQKKYKAKCKVLRALQDSTEDRRSGLLA